MLALGLYYFTFVFLRQILIDLVAFQGDLILGRETLPTWLGIKKSSILAYGLAAVTSVIIITSVICYGMYIYLIFLIPMAYYAILMTKIEKTDYLISLMYEFIIDANFIFFLILFMVS